jgi:ferrous-iron efflux pump FieF
MIALEGEERAALSSRAALASVAVAFVLLLARAGPRSRRARRDVGSLADTILDLVASLATFVGIRIAALPADYDTPVRSRQSEALVALAQVVLITVSAIASAGAQSSN